MLPLTFPSFPDCLASARPLYTLHCSHNLPYFRHSRVTTLHTEPLLPCSTTQDLPLMMLYSPSTIWPLIGEANHALDNFFFPHRTHTAHTKQLWLFISSTHSFPQTITSCMENEQTIHQGETCSALCYCHFHSQFFDFNSK